MTQFVVYKALFGSYDSIEPVKSELVQGNTDYFVISDIALDLPAPWKLIQVERKFDSYAVENRFYKMNGLDWFKNYKRSIYLDGNINVTGSLDHLLENLGTDKDIYAFAHPKRSNVSDEFKACLIYNKITIQEYLESKKESYQPFKDAQIEMFECGILIRNPNSSVLSAAMKEWFELFENHIRRDQLYFPFVMEKHKVNIGSLGISNIRSNSEFFSIKSHTHKTRWVDRKKVLLYKKLNKLFKWL
ncbi:hypothetical protein OTK51_11540 [Vibrio scophthalmi]|uniref:hypothetical protein n=1 Tax=Vibrio scophthalmi TaxID=45658 RepID=UPI002283BE85|nr:hypothetical protein [Vibrio scophthalmi]MCY9804061.1 hypothetical protein [Vibrio scophthalmi]